MRIERDLECLEVTAPSPRGDVATAGVQQFSEYGVMRVSGE